MNIAACRYILLTHSNIQRSQYEEKQINNYAVRSTKVGSAYIEGYADVRAVPWWCERVFLSVLYGKIHRDDGPARIFTYSGSEWWLHGRPIKSVLADGTTYEVAKTHSWWSTKCDCARCYHAWRGSKDFPTIKKFVMRPVHAPFPLIWIIATCVLLACLLAVVEGAMPSDCHSIC